MALSNFDEKGISKMGIEILGAIAIVASAIIGGAVSVYQTEKSEEQADRNFEAQQKYNESQSISSKIAEAKENGVSPLAVLDNVSTSSVVSAPQASADYSGLSSFASSIMNMGSSFATNKSQEKISKDKNASAEKINKMTIQNEKDIADSKLSAESKNLALQLNTQLQIATDKNSTDTEINNARIKCYKYVEELKQQNQEFLQDKQFAQSIKEIELDQNFKAKENKKDRSHDTAMTWINNVQQFISNLISTAGSLARGFVGSKI